MREWRKEKGRCIAPIFSKLDSCGWSRILYCPTAVIIIIITTAGEKYIICGFFQSTSFGTYAFEWQKRIEKLMEKSIPADSEFEGIFPPNHIGLPQR